MHPDPLPSIRRSGGGPSNGSLLQATREQPTTLDGSWKRLVVSGVAPESTTSALLVVGEVAGTPAPVSFLLDDAQLQRATTSGPYVETGEQTGGRPSHPTDLAALLMLAAAGLLAFATLGGAVLVALPLSLAIPPSFANLGSHVPDVTPTRALVIGCFAVAVARGQLRAPPRWIVALGVLYSTIVLAAFVRDASFVSMRLALSLTIGAFAPALLVIAVARARRDVSVLAISLAATGGVVAVIALAEWYFNRHWIPLFPGVIFDALERADHLRARATFPHPIVLGTFLAMALQLTLSLMLTARGSRRILAGVGLLVVACGLAVTLSRAPWLAAIVALAALASLSGVWRRWKIILALAVALLALVASPLGVPMRDAAASLVRPKSEQDRFVVQMRIDATKRIGGSGVRNLVGSSLDPAARPAFPAVIEGREIDLGDSIDNTYVRELSQTGLLGLLALTALLLAAVIETTKGARSEDAETRFLASGLVATQVVVLVVGLTVGTIAFSQVGTAFWLVAGAGIATSRLRPAHRISLGARRSGRPWTYFGDLARDRRMVASCAERRAVLRGGCRSQDRRVLGARVRRTRARPARVRRIRPRLHRCPADGVAGGHGADIARPSPGRDGAGGCKAPHSGRPSRSMWLHRWCVPLA